MAEHDSRHKAGAAPRTQPRPAWRSSGEEPDYRFTLANERTFLAWVRTALAVLAAGVLLDQFSTKLQPHLLVVGTAILLCVVAGTLALLAYTRWRDNEVSMRHRHALPHSRMLAILTVAVVLICAVLAVLMAWAIAIHRA
jgi:putative membrane protein